MRGGQSLMGSSIEQTAQVVIKFFLAWGLTIWVMPYIIVEGTATEALHWTLLMAVNSWVFGLIIRRISEWVLIRSIAV